LEKLPDAVEKHDADSLGILADGERADSRDAHQKVFVKKFAADDVRERAKNNAAAENGVGRGEQRQRRAVRKRRREQAVDNHRGGKHGGAYGELDNLAFGIVAVAVVAVFRIIIATNITVGVATTGFSAHVYLPLSVYPVYFRLFPLIE